MNDNHNELNFYEDLKVYLSRQKEEIDNEIAELLKDEKYKKLRELLKQKKELIKDINRVSIECEKNIQKQNEYIKKK